MDAEGQDGGHGKGVSEWKNLQGMNETARFKKPPDLVKLAQQWYSIESSGTPWVHCKDSSVASFTVGGQGMLSITEVGD